MSDPWRLFYDGGCNLCHESKLRAEVWAQRAGQPLIALPLQSEQGVGQGYAGDEMKLEADGTVFSAARAWVKLLTIAPWYLRWLAPVGRTRFGAALISAVYGIVAKYRLRWFGTRACQLPKRTDGNHS